MPKLSIDDLKKIREQTRSMINLREGSGRAKITVHLGTCGIASGAKEVLDELTKELKNREIKDVIIITSGCAGLCSREPMATVELLNSPPVKYVDLTKSKIKEILEKHILGGAIISEYALAIGNERIY